MPLFKAIIRVVKSIAYNDFTGFDRIEVLREPVIEAVDKSEVKEKIKEMYPQFFQNGKVYEKETKDSAQFFYVLIYPLYNHEIEMINEGPWTCSSCGHVHDNKYVSRPQMNERLLGAGVMFCKSEGDVCMKKYKAEKYRHVELPDDEAYIKKGAPIYIYKCTEKATGKCYVGKTRNAPFFRWWNHLTHSSSPFGKYLRSTKLSDWTFEVLEELPAETADSEVFRIESEYIVKFDSIRNGYNSVISKTQEVEDLQMDLFTNEQTTTI